MSIEWIAADWQAPPGVIAGTTTRGGGVSEGPYRSLNLGAHVEDEPARVSENRRRLLLECELPSEPVWLNQTHSTVVAPGCPESAGSSADAIVCTNADVVCAIMTADCLPVLMTARDGSEIAAVHAGWRGLCAGVLENVVARMTCGPDALMAWLGPAISQPAFEVGSEVRDAFVAEDPAAEQAFVPNDRGRFQADLCKLARQRLARAGVTDVSGGHWCTHADEQRFFSFRRDGQCGRMASFIWRKPSQ